MNIIDKIALILISKDGDSFISRPGQLLVARSKGKKLFNIPGGKRDEGESDQDTLCREIDEELDVAIIKDSIEYANTFEAPADSKDDVIVRIACYYAEIEGTPHPCQEIEALQWVSLDNKERCSLITQRIIEWLCKQKKMCVD